MKVLQFRPEKDKQEARQNQEQQMGTGNAIIVDAPYVTGEEQQMVMNESMDGSLQDEKSYPIHGTPIRANEKAGPQSQQTQ